MRGIFGSLSFRVSWLFWIAFAAACAAIPVGWYWSQYVRLSALELEGCGFPESFLMLSKTRENRGYLVDRSAATVRRGDQKPGGRMWNTVRFNGGAGGPDSWFVQSKTSGSTFLITVEDVHDWTCPFFYGFVRRELPDLDLADVYWTQLFVNRVYSGLYLKVELPVDPRKRDGGSGIRREIMEARDDRLWIVDTRLDPETRLFHDLVAAGTFPSPGQPSAVTAWLGDRCAVGGRTLLLDNAEPWQVSSLPLPVSIVELYERMYGRPLEPVRSERFRWWAVDEATAQPPEIFTPDQRARLEHDFDLYREDFRLALTAHRLLHGTPKMEPGAGSDPRLPVEDLQSFGL